MAESVKAYCRLFFVILFPVLLLAGYWAGRVSEFTPAYSAEGFVTGNLSTVTFKAWKDGLVTKLKPEIQRNCGKIFKGDKNEVKRLQMSTKKWRSSVSDKDLFKATLNCSWVRDYFYNNLYVTKLEQSFPIAFAFLVYNSPQQVIRLLKVLYRPHNQYCIHPDQTSGSDFIGTFENIAQCLDNVHVASKLINVSWGHRSIMESLMQCYRDLIGVREKQNERDKWRYVINLCGKELPLNTNHDIVSHLVRLNETSMVDSVKVPSDSWRFNHRLKNKTIPYSSKYYQSSLYMSVSYKFVNYLLTSAKAQHLFEFFGEYCELPEEHYFAAVYMLPDAPGGFNPNLPKNYTFEVDHYFWMSIPENKKECQGKNIHHICVVEIGDVNKILRVTDFGKKALFQNKYFMDNDHLIMDCMEKHIIAKNVQEYANDLSSL